MIAAVFKRIVALLLIFGWVSLSGFDLVEDLDQIPKQLLLSGSAGDGGASKRGGWGTLANNTLESATRTSEADVAVFSFTVGAFQFEPACDFRRYFQLHKLYRVFLI